MMDDYLSHKIQANDLYNTSEQKNPLSYFFASNKIISSLHPIKSFFDNFQSYSVEEQQKILNELLIALRTVSTNSYFLNQRNQSQNLSMHSDKKLNQPSNEMSEEADSTILAYILELLEQNLQNYVIFNLLLQILDEILPYSSLNEKIIKKSTQNIMTNYYEGKVKVSELFISTNILKSFLNSKLQSQKHPKNMLAFHGSKGIEISSNTSKPLPWIFSSGMTMCLWINLQNIKTGTDTPLSKIFTIFAPDKGGIESYIIDNKIFYRIIGTNYTQPQLGSNGLLLGTLEPKKWNFICFQHEGHKTFNKSKLYFYLNRNKPASYSLDLPKISTEKTKYIFFDKIYCKSSSICIFPSAVGFEVIDEFNKNINSLENVKHAKALVFQQRQGFIYERSGFGQSMTYILERNLEMNFKILLPYFYLLRFHQEPHEYPILNELLGVIVIFLRKSPQYQTEAYTQEYFKIISELICQIPQDLFDQNTIKVILHIKHTITDTLLLDQYFSDFLWSLLKANIKTIRKEQILQIIKHQFTQNIAHYSPLIGLDQIINFLLEISTNHITCCEKHFKIVSQKFQKDISKQSTFGDNKVIQNYVLSLIQLVFQNPKINYAQECYKLCRLLSLKFSPCFILDLIQLIKKILTQKFSQKLSQSQVKKILKYFNEKKVHLIFIHVIQNNFFAEIKAQSIKLIYTILIKKSSSIEEIDVSDSISKALWKINESFEDDTLKKSLLSSEKKSNNNEQQNQIDQKIKLSQIPESQQFSLVGPQAPALSNRLKGQKTFDFNFINANQEKPPIRHSQIMEQEKTAEPEIDLQNFEAERKKKDKKKFSLSINTEAINQMFSYGGQNCKQVIVSQEQQIQELQRIKKLARKCVAIMKGMDEQVVQQQNQRKIKVFTPPPPPTTRNKDLAAKKGLYNLSLITQQQEPVFKSVPTPLAAKKSSKSPTSIKSTNQQNLFILYNSLLECCLGVSFQTSLISNTKVQVPSILSIFFKWIPQTDLQTKFLNDLQIMLQFHENKLLILEIPELYDFIFELSYKCLVFQEMGERRVYCQKLENLIKIIFSHVFKEDPAGLGKFTFIIDWSESKKDEYHPKCLFLSERYVILLMLQSIEEYLLMSNSNDKLMERNFQSFSFVLDNLRKNIYSNDQSFVKDQFQRVMFNQEMDLPQSLIPYFKSQWTDFILYQKYLFLFKRFYCTDWYLKGLKAYNQNANDLLEYLRQCSINQIFKQSSYYMKNNFLVELIEINRSMLVQLTKTNSKEAQEYANEAIWQTICLIIFSEVNKEKTLKNQKSQIILSFLKSCKMLAELNVEGIAEIISMLSSIKHFTTISQNSTPQQKIFSASTQVLDEIIDNYIPGYLLNMQKGKDLESFKLHFAEVWIPSDGQYKKVHSQMFINHRQKIKKSEENTTNFIQFVTNIIQQENERHLYTKMLLQANSRYLKNKYRKIWQSLRIYSICWIHPSMKCQQDFIFTKTLYNYDKYSASPFYKFKIAKHHSKNKARYLLKLRLTDPKIDEKEQAIEQKDKSEYCLHQAILSLNQKIEMGRSKVDWLLSKQEQQISIIMEFKKVRIINTLTIRNGHLGIMNNKIIFLPSYEIEKPTHLAIEQYRIRKDKTIHKIWPLEYIKQVLKRRYVNKKRAVQLNFIQGKSVFIEFTSQDESDQFCKRLLKLRGSKCTHLLYNGKTIDNKKILQASEATNKWTNHQITNFEYLMELNSYAGRSYSDVTQYPVMPWTLINFKAAKGSLTEQGALRDLSLPMGILGGQDRRKAIEQRYEAMCHGQMEGANFHYGTHYSSPGIVYHFLVRLSPFTEGAILLQSGKFDFADRLFFSIVDSFRNAISDYSDVRELLPELYTLPECYLNLNHLNLGVMQNSRRVNNVDLPDWCRENPYLWVARLRRAMEEPKISEDLSKWIDLIFGYKQRGQEAIKSLNCFVYLTYEDAVDWEHIENQKQVKAIESQILNFGQTPSQLFVKPHPDRSNLVFVRQFNLLCDPNSQLKVYRPSKNRSLLSQPLQTNPFKQPDEAIIQIKWAKENKLVLLRRNGEMIVYRWHIGISPTSKIPFQCTIDKEKKIQRIKKVAFDPQQFYDPSLSVHSFPIEILGSGSIICLGGLSGGKLVLFEAETSSLIECYTTHKQTISCVKADHRQNFVITGDIGGSVVVWTVNANNGLTYYKSMKDMEGQISSIFFSSELLCYGISSYDGTIILYNTITGKKMKKYTHNFPINELIISTSPLASVLFFCNYESTMYLYSINGQLLQKIAEPSPSIFLSPVLLKDSSGFEYVAYGNQKGEVMMRSLPFLTERERKNQVAKEACVNRVCVSRNGRFLVTGCSDGDMSVICDPNAANQANQ